MVIKREYLSVLILKELQGLFCGKQAEKVQKNVKSSVQNMTNVTVSRVNLVIAGVAGTEEQ